MIGAALRLASLGCLAWATSVMAQGGMPEGTNACRLAVPPVVYAAAGTEVNLYFQNLILAPPGRVWIIDVTCAKGMQQVERWTWAPQDEDAGEVPLSIEVRDENDQVAARGRTTVRVSAANRGSGRPLRLLCIGDSLTHHSVYTGELLKLCAGPGQPELKLLGTHHPDGAGDGNVHEGYGARKGVRTDNVQRKAEEQTVAKGVIPIPRKGPADSKPDAKILDRVLQMDGETVARELPAEHQLITHGWGHLLYMPYDGGLTWPEEVEPRSGNGASGVGVNEVALHRAANGGLVAACRITHPKYCRSGRQPRQRCNLGPVAPLRPGQVVGREPGPVDLHRAAA